MPCQGSELPVVCRLPDGGGDVSTVGEEFFCRHIAVFHYQTILPQRTFRRCHLGQSLPQRNFVDTSS